MALAAPRRTATDWGWASRARGEAAASHRPSEVTSFVGRERELDRLREMHAVTRLLTLVGPGGVGKTRLALRLETELSEAFPDGTWLVDLSQVADSTLVPQVVADVFGVRRQPDESWVHELTRVLRPRRVLLVLDNCEHLIAACALLVNGLLRGCPELHILATSLQPLGLAGETTWRVPPLVLPPLAGSDLGAVRASEAVRLFVARVQDHLPDFSVGEHNATHVSEICRRLDGLPLALELVAARIESLGVAEVAARLIDSIALAGGNSRTAPARQRTLQAALDWSWGLLAVDELVLLRRLAVFVGGWTLAEAEAVCADAQLPMAQVVDALGRLVSRSLVVADHEGVSVRYRLLETVRAHARRQLDAVGETDALRRRHATALLELAEQEPPETLDPTRIARLRPEEGNVRAALEWAVEAGDAELGLRLALGAFSLWIFSGHYTEGRAWFDRCLALPNAALVATQPLALTFTTQLRVMLGEYAAALVYGQAALEAHRTQGDERGIGLTLTVLGNAALQMGDLAQAAALHATAARILYEQRNPGVMTSLFQGGLIALEQGDAARTLELVEELEVLGRERGRAVMLALHLRGMVETAAGHDAAAVRFFEQALEHERQAGDQQAIVTSLTGLGHVRIDQGQSPAALAAFGEAMQLARASGERIRLIRAIEGCARALASGDADAAVRLAGATDRQRQLLGALPWPRDRHYLETWLMQARRALGQSAFQRAWEDGHASTLDQAIDLVQAITVRPRVAGLPGDALTPREREVAMLLARGLTNKQIAAELIVSPATVRSHVEHVLNKLDLRSRAQIAVWASQQGLLTPPAAP